MDLNYLGRIRFAGEPGRSETCPALVSVSIRKKPLSYPTKTHDTSDVRDNLKAKRSRGTDDLKALVWEAPRVMTMRDQAELSPLPGEVVIKVAYVGICGS